MKLNLNRLMKISKYFLTNYVTVMVILTLKMKKNLKNSIKNWFDAECKRSLMQSATVLDKVFPTDQPDKELLIKTAYEIMEFKVEQLEKILKNKR